MTNEERNRKNHPFSIGWMEYSLKCIQNMSDGKEKVDPSDFEIFIRKELSNDIIIDTVKEIEKFDIEKFDFGTHESIEEFIILSDIKLLVFSLSKAMAEKENKTVDEIINEEYSEEKIFIKDKFIKEEVAYVSKKIFLDIIKNIQREYIQRQLRPKTNQEILAKFDMFQEVESSKGNDPFDFRKFFKNLNDDELFSLAHGVISFINSDQRELFKLPPKDIEILIQMANDVPVPKERESDKPNMFAWLVQNLFTIILNEYIKRKIPND
jgi:hypothetical protein